MISYCKIIAKMPTMEWVPQCPSSMVLQSQVSLYFNAVWYILFRFIPFTAVHGLFVRYLTQFLIKCRKSSEKWSETSFCPISSFETSYFFRCGYEWRPCDWLRRVHYPSNKEDYPQCSWRQVPIMFPVYMPQDFWFFFCRQVKCTTQYVSLYT